MRAVLLHPCSIKESRCDKNHKTEVKRQRQGIAGMANCLLFQSSFKLGAKMMVEVMDDR